VSCFIGTFLAFIYCAYACPSFRYKKEAQFDNAIAQYEEVLTIVRKLDNKGTAEQALVLQGLAKVYSEKQDYGEAVGGYNALEFCPVCLPTHHSKLNRWLIIIITGLLSDALDVQEERLGESQETAQVRIVLIESLVWCVVREFVTPHATTNQTKSHPQPHIPSIIHAFMHSCIHAFMHSCIHAFMHSCMHFETTNTI
jgi:hypothetical protein